MTFEELEKKVIQWGFEKNIYSQSDAVAQMKKLGEEYIELVMSDNEDDAIDAVGDMMVVLTHIAVFMQVTLNICYESAYNEIKDRKGKMINGIFVKE